MIEKLAAASPFIKMVSLHFSMSLGWTLILLGVTVQAIQCAASGLHFATLSLLCTLEKGETAVFRRVKSCTNSRWKVKLLIIIEELWNSTLCYQMQQTFFNMTLWSSTLEKRSPKTRSSTIHNFWYTYWFCVIILGYLDLSSSIGRMIPQKLEIMKRRKGGKSQRQV
jgi:hypothetical protein